MAANSSSVAHDRHLGRDKRDRHPHFVVRQDDHRVARGQHQRDRFQRKRIGCQRERSRSIIALYLKRLRAEL